MKGSPQIWLLLLLSSLSLVLADVVLMATMIPTVNSTFYGTVTFVAGPADSGVDVTVRLFGGAKFANQTFSLAVTTYGDVSKLDGSATGPRFSLSNKTIPGLQSTESPGCYPSRTRESGNLGNVTATAQGDIIATIFSEKLSVSPLSLGFVLGRGVVLRQTPDLCTNATGQILSQGVIGYQSDSSDVQAPNDIFTAINTTQLVCVMVPLDGSGVKGNIYWQQRKSSAPTMISQLYGLKPNKTYSMRVHDYGDLSDDEDAASTGEHFDPFNSKHGCARQTSTYHAGDLGNFIASPRGTLNSTFEFPLLSLSATTMNSIVGRSMILQRDADNCIDNPIESVARIGFCVLGYSAYDPSISPPVTSRPSAAGSLSLNFSFVVFSLLALLFSFRQL